MTSTDYKFENGLKMFHDFLSKQFDTETINIIFDENINVDLETLKKICKLLSIKFGNNFRINGEEIKNSNHITSLDGIQIITKTLHYQI